MPDILISCHMAGWLANCSWQAGWLTDCLWHKMSNWPSLPPHIWPPQSLTGWYLVTWLVGWPITAGWLATYHTKCQPDPPPGRDMLWPCVWLLRSHRPVVRCTPCRDIQWSRAVLCRVMLTFKSGTNLGPVVLSSCSIVCNRPSWVFKSSLQ